MLPVLIPLKCLDALFGADSSHRRVPTKTIRHYKYYMGFILLPKYASKEKGENKDEHRLVDANREMKKGAVVVPLTTACFWRLHVSFLRWFLVTVAVYHILLPSNFRPFPEKSDGRDPATDMYPTFDIARIYNTFIQAVVLFLTLIFSMYGVATISCLTANMQVCDSKFDRQPLFCATSPSDFWGRRWNSLVHHHLKKGVYKPFRAA